MKVKNILLRIFLLLVFCVLVYGLYQTNTHSVGQVVDLTEDTLLIEPIEKSKVTIEDSIVNFALKYLGTPYIYGACSKDGFDCSGFVYFVFDHFNIEVPRSSSQYETFGKTIPEDEIQKGDILVFLSPTRNKIGHLGMVTKIKDKSVQFIHASSGGEMPVIISELNSTSYKKRFVKAIRVL